MDQINLLYTLNLHNVRKIPWRRAWQPTPVFYLKKFHGHRRLGGYGTQGHKEPGMTEATEHAHTKTYVDVLHFFNKNNVSKIKMNNNILPLIFFSMI